MESLERKDASTGIEEPIKSEGLPAPSPATSERSNGAASPPPHCSICLGKLINTSFTDSCLHQFCFTCLLQWSKIKTECPLCKQTFKSIIHNVRSEEDYDQYHVQYHVQSQVASAVTLDVTADIPDYSPLNLVLQPPYRNNAFMYRTTSGYLRRHGLPLINPEAVARREQIPSVPHQVSYEERRRRAINPVDFRKAVYRQGLWAAPLPDAFGGYRESSAEYYRRHPQEVNRLVPWLNRELQALLNDNQPHIAYVINVLTEAFTRFNIQSPAFRNLARQYFGANADHFVHELARYACTNFDLIGYDQSVVYAPDRGISNRFVDRVVTSPDTRGRADSSTSSSDSSDSDVRVVNQTYDFPRNRFHSVNINMPSGLHIIDAPGPSSMGHAMRYPYVSYMAPDILTISSTSSSEGECEVVGYVKPRHERTPEIIDLSSSDEERNNTATTSNERNQSETFLQKDENLNLPGTSSSSGDNIESNNFRRTRRCAEDIVKAVEAQLYEYLNSSSESDSEENDSDYYPSRKLKSVRYKRSPSKKSSKSSNPRKLRNSRKRTNKTAAASSRVSRKQRCDKVTSSKRNRSASYSNTDEDNESPFGETSATRGTKRYLSKSSDADSDYEKSTKKNKKSKKTKSSKRSKRRSLKTSGSSKSVCYNYSSSDDDRSSLNSSSCYGFHSKTTGTKNSHRKKKRKLNTSCSSEAQSANEDKSCPQSSSSTGPEKQSPSHDSSRLVDYDLSDEAKSPRRSSSESLGSCKNSLEKDHCTSDEEHSSCYTPNEHEDEHSPRNATKSSCDSSNVRTRTASSQSETSDGFGFGASVVPSMASTSETSDGSGFGASVVPSIASTSVASDGSGFGASVVPSMASTSVASDGSGFDASVVPSTVSSSVATDGSGFDASVVPSTASTSAASDGSSFDPSVVPSTASTSAASDDSGFGPSVVSSKRERHRSHHKKRKSSKKRKRSSR